MKSPTLYLEAARTLSGVPNLISNYDSSNLCSLGDMTFFVI